MSWVEIVLNFFPFTNVLYSPHTPDTSVCSTFKSRNSYSHIPSKGLCWSTFLLLISDQSSETQCWRHTYYVVLASLARSQAFYTSSFCNGVEGLGMRLVLAAHESTYQDCEYINQDSSIPHTHTHTHTQTHLRVNSFQFSAVAAPAMSAEREGLDCSCSCS